MLLPDEIIKRIFEYAGEYRYYPQFQKNKIVRSIFHGDHIYELLSVIPKKQVIHIPPYKHFHVLVEFDTIFEDLTFRMSFKETEYVSEDTGEPIPEYKEYKLCFTKVDRRHTAYSSLKIYTHTLK